MRASPNSNGSTTSARCFCPWSKSPARILSSCDIVVDVLQDSDQEGRTKKLKSCCKMNGYGRWKMGGWRQRLW